MGFGTFLRNRDSFGHPVTVGYKGSDTYSTNIGGILSLLVKGFTAALVFMSLQELVLMEDPQIRNYTRPLSKKGREELIPVKFSEYDYILAVETDAFYLKDGKKFNHIPVEIGRLVA